MSLWVILNVRIRIRISVNDCWLRLLVNNFVSSLSAGTIQANAAKSNANRHSYPKPTQCVYFTAWLVIANIAFFKKRCISTAFHKTTIRIRHWHQTCIATRTFVTLWCTNKNLVTWFIAPRRFVFWFVYRILFALKFLVIFPPWWFVCLSFGFVTDFTHIFIINNKQKIF